MDLSLIIHYDKSYIGIFKYIRIRESEKVVEVQRSDLVGEHIGGTASKTAKIIKKTEGGVLFIDEAYTLCLPSERDFGKEAVETLMANMNNNVNPKIKSPIMIFAGCKEQINDFLKMNPGLTRRVKTVSNFADFTPEELCGITKCKILQQSIRVLLGIEKEFISCFRKIPNSVIAQFNTELCNELFEAILTEQERRLNLHCTAGELEKFTGEDVPNGIKEFLKRKIVSDEVSVKSAGTNTDFVCTCYKSPEIILNIPGKLPLPVNPISEDESKAQ